MNNAMLYTLASAAGIEISWRNVDGYEHVVSDDSLRAVLAALGFPASTNDDIAQSLAALTNSAGENLPPLITADAGKLVIIQAGKARFKITLETGGVIEGVYNGTALPPLPQSGYHQLEIGNATTILAIAPPRAYTLDDVAQGAKLWGLAVQLYALRRKADGGIGDFAALENFVRAAAAHGADAVAISPVHAQFSSDVTRFGPYAPSNRAAFNALHIAEPDDIQDTGELINWPAAGAAKIVALRKAFQNFNGHEALAAYREKAGPGLELHALFEAIQSKFHSTTPDWRLWPAEFRSPNTPTVQKFLKDNSKEIAFHAYLQHRADEGLHEAQRAAREAGMKIGLIADLAVGTDHAGSHSWSRQKEVLQGLELGAPPDAINREGQSWGITAFSPHGLQNSGFSGFIEMLRHALRHAGGVRIDHVMGLARLWVIPTGRSSAEGAYLRMPVQDLMRLVILESQRHRAVILGEDLGTLPDGFQTQLDSAGISGLRVMWFERTGAHFNPPSLWTKTATAMTSTHDLPTVAGWWQSEDIAWRNKLHMAGENEDTRAAARAELWAAFRNSGAATTPIPPPEDGAVAADAACAHLGHAACTLALLPIEDALASPEQPNLPGTVDEHPNWRRRLPFPADEILNQPDVSRRLAALNTARRLK